MTDRPRHGGARPPRSVALGRMIVPRKGRGTFRTPADEAEVARRVAIYTRQYERTGRLSWLPHKGEVHGCAPARSA